MPWARNDGQGEQGGLPVEDNAPRSHLGGPAFSSEDEPSVNTSNPSTSNAVVRSGREPEINHHDWEAVQGGRGPQFGGMPGGSSPTGRQMLGAHNLHGTRDSNAENDEDLDQRASDLANKPCYFDLELGEAGPASLGHDHSSVRERRWHRFRSGATYDGEWLGGVRDGVGKQCWPDGTVYVGEWRRGRAHNRGEIRHYDGDIYTGEWVNGRAHGSGVFRHQGSHAIYEGEFRCDMREGVGVELWVDGSWYAGDFRKGVKQGHGEHRWPMLSGTNYVGSWRGNELAGPGRYFVKDGPSYQGQWMNSVIDGAGVYTWLDGRQYEGQYSMDRKHGFGILTSLDGDSNERFWDQGQICREDPLQGPQRGRHSLDSR